MMMVEEAVSMERIITCTMNVSASTKSNDSTVKLFCTECYTRINCDSCLPTVGKVNKTSIQIQKRSFNYFWDTVMWDQPEI